MAPGMRWIQTCALLIHEARRASMFFAHAMISSMKTRHAPKANPNKNAVIIIVEFGLKKSYLFNFSRIFRGTSGAGTGFAPSAIQIVDTDTLV